MLIAAGTRCCAGADHVDADVSARCAAFIGKIYSSNAAVALHSQSFFAKNWVTHAGCAQYFGPSDYGTPAETTAAAANYESTHDPVIPIALRGNCQQWVWPVYPDDDCWILFRMEIMGAGFGVQKIVATRAVTRQDYQPWGSESLE